MGVNYVLVNYTKREHVTFRQLGAGKMNELVCSPATSAVTTWYLLNNLGDEISFVTDSEDDWPFSGGHKSDLSSYREMTEIIVEELIRQGTLRDHGLIYEDDPDIDDRDIRYVWCPCSRS